MKKLFRSFNLIIFLCLIVFSNFSVLFSQIDSVNKNANQIYIRVDLTTTSDWTAFKWETIPDIITMRVFAVEGTDMEYEVFYDRIKIAQKKKDAESKIRILVDYLLNVKSEENWKFYILRGEIGKTNLKVIVKNDLLFDEIYSINHDKSIDTDRTENKISGVINLKFKTGFKFIPEEKNLEKIPKLLLAFYYLWYTKDNWKIFPLVDEPEKFYSSSDIKIIRKQINLAKSSGLDGFITSWDGPRTYSDNNFKLFLQECTRLNFKSSIYYETLTENGPKSDEEIYSSLKFIIENYGNHKAFIKIFNKPLIFIWASNEISINRWRRILNQLRVNNYEATFVAMGYDISNLLLFDGLHQYGVILIDDLMKEYNIVSNIVKNYHLIADKQKIWTATVQPGYDERKIPKRIGLFKERSGGKYYKETWEAAINSNPDLILITSWNEWWENTHIEPSKNFKNYYLNITKKYSRIWKKG